MSRAANRVSARRILGAALVVSFLVGCTAAPAAAPTAAPAKPAATATTAPAAKPTAAPTAASAAKPTTAPAAKPAVAASPQAATYDKAAVAQFYQGKTFKVLVGLGAGGGFDTIYRIWARHASQHIPGNPTIIVENMTGAGSLVLANHLYNAAPKDGTEMGAFDLFINVLGQASGAPGIQFNAARYNWLGNPGDSTPVVCAIRSDLGFNSFSEVLKSGHELVLGASGRGNVFYATPSVLAAATGAKVKIVEGYNGNAAVRLAVENKELDGACWEWGSMRASAPNWFEGDQPLMKVILQGGTSPSADLPKVELLRSFVKDPELIKMVDVLETSIYHDYLAAFPPDVPADRVAALREAYMATWNDAETQADLKKAKLVFTPVTGEETAKVVNQLLALPEAQAKEIGKTFGLIQ